MPFMRDPFARILTDRLRFSVWGGGIFAFLLSAIYTLILPAAFGIFATEAGALASPSDFSDMGILLIIAPAVWIYYLWQTQGIPGVFTTLVRSAQNPGAMNDEVERQRQSHGRSAWHVIVSFAIACGLSLLNVRLSWTALGETWTTYNWQMIAAMQVIRLPVFYMVSMIIIKLGISSILINRIVTRQPLKIILMHPDGRGGVSGLGMYAIASAAIIPLAGLYLGLVLAR